VIEATPAFAFGHDVHRVEIVGQVAICDAFLAPPLYKTKPILSVWFQVYIEN
jgi:hypothetical protein